MENQELRGARLSDCGPGQPIYEGAVPTPIVENKIRQINIEEVNRGYIVRVGCHTFAIGTKAELISNLTEYINEPTKTEKKWFSGELFK